MLRLPGLAGLGGGLDMIGFATRKNDKSRSLIVDW